MHLPRSTSRRVLFLVCYTGFLAVVLWLGGRLYATWKLGVPLMSAVKVWDYYYRELRDSGVLAADIKPHDDFIDVVMLGGSTIDRGFGNVAIYLKTGLQREFGDRVRIFNLAKAAHTSRDSLLKFSTVAHKPFDLILIYDGFNDCRMNNCPADLFRDDYTHCTWYQSFEDRRRAGTLSLPQEILRDATQTIGLGEPDRNLVQYGADLKTPEPFRRNLEEILKIARPESAVLLQSFAYHIPDDYSLSRFDQGLLSYSKEKGYGTFPVEMWGRPPDIAKCVAAHNQMIQRLVKSHPQQTFFIDQNRLIPHDGRHFVDACHFTDAGCRKYVDNILPAVIKRLRQSRAVPAK